MDFNLRHATPDDAEALARLHIDAWRVAYRGLVPDTVLEQLDYARRAARFRESLAANREETYVAERAGKLVGFLTLGPCRDEDLDPATTGEIWGIYLAPAFWRQGIGSMLFRWGEHLLISRGYTGAVLWVFAGNESARRFYEHLGFAPDGASKILERGKPLEVVRYHKTLEVTP